MVYTAWEAHSLPLTIHMLIGKMSLQRRVGMCIFFSSMQ